jgi:nucleoside-diphosphate-sugar epimerase
MRVLVSGAAGFVGANLVRQLSGDGHEVHALVRPGTDSWRLDGVGLDGIHSLALEDGDRVRGVVHELRPEWIFHLAAYGAYPTQIDGAAMAMSNVLGTMHLLDAAMSLGFSSFVHTGTSSEYGFKSRPPDEDTVLEPNSAYAVTKAAATLYCRQAAVRAGAPVITARLYSAYGPWEAPTRLIPSVLIRALGGSWPPLVAPHTARDFIFVEDVVSALCCLAAAADIEPGEVVNVGSGEQRTVADVVEIVRRLLPVEAAPPWNTLEPRTWDTTTWVGDVARIRSRFGWRAMTSLDAGLAATLAWLTSDRERLDRYRQEIDDPTD